MSARCQQERARSHIDELSNHYLGTDHQMPIGPHGWVILKIAPTKVITSG